MNSRESLVLELNAWPHEMKRLVSLHVSGEVGAQARLSIFASVGYLRQRIDTARKSGAITAKEHLHLNRRLDRLRRRIYNALSCLDALADEGEGFLDPLSSSQLQFEVVL